MPETQYPLDLTELERSALACTSDCLLIGNGALESIEMKAPLKNQAPASKLSIGLTRNSGRLATQAELTGAREKGVKLILWDASPAQTDILKKSLWNATRTGIWNHLNFRPGENDTSFGLMKFALNNTDIVNSWSFSEKQIVAPSAVFQKEMADASGYASVKPLPGKPLWMTLDDPERLLQFLHRFGIHSVLRWRVMEDGCQVHQLGRSIDYCYVKPDNLPAGLLNEICRMVKAGGSVDMKQVRYNLQRAFLIGYVLEFGQVVGNSSLKQPRAEYIQSLNRNTGLDFSNYLERGYTSVRPEYRGLGIGTKLLGGLTRRAGERKFFSIITEDNLATQKMAIRNQTRKLTTFFSQKTGKQVGVWIPE